MKKINITALLLALVMVIGMFTACASGPKTEVSVFTLKGPTGMGMVQLMQNAEDGKADGSYKFELCSAPTEIVAAISSGEADIAACPVNLASTLYNKTNGNVTVLAVNTMGVMYVLDATGTVKSIADLKGKTVYTSGKGSTPQYITERLLRANGLDPNADVELIYLGEHSEVVAQAAAGNADIVILPEPNVTVLQSKDSRFAVALDLTAEWNKVEDFELIQGCIIARTDFLNEHKDAVDVFLNEYKASVDFVAENPAEAAALIEKYGIVASAAMAEKALPRCNIVYKGGGEMQRLTEGNLKVLFDADPTSVGGKLPGEGFYYLGK